MKNRTELMAELIDKADWIIRYEHEPRWPSQAEMDEYNKICDEYTRLRDELAEVKERSAVTWNDVKERYLEFHKMDSFTENMAIDIDFGYWLVNQFASQSPKMPTEDLCKCGIPTPDADRECCTICGKLICGE